MTISKKSKPSDLKKEEQFTGLLNILPDVVMIHKDGIIIYANQAALIATGCTKKELIGSYVLNYVAEEYRDTIIKKMQLREAGEKFGDYVCELIRKTGEKRTAIVRSSDIFFNDEPAVLFILIDITNRINEEKKLEEINEKYRLLVHYTSDPIFSINPDDTYRFVNEAFAERLGLTPEEIIGKTAYDYYPPDGAERRLSLIHRVFLTGEKGELETNHLLKSGEIRYYITKVDPVKDESGKVLWVTCIATNITERKKAENALTQSNQKLEAIISASPDGIGMISLDGKMQFMSDKLIEIYGYPVEMKNDLMGRIAYDFIDPTEHARLYKNVLKLISGKSDRNLSEYLAIKRDNSRFYVELNSTALYDFDGNPEYILFVEREISKRKIAEAEVNRHNEEIAALYETTHDLSGLPMDINNLLTIITQRAISLLKGAYGGVYLFDEEKGDLCLVVETIPTNLTGNRIKLGEGLAGMVAQTRKPMIIDDYRKWPNRLNVYHNIPLTAIIEVPMIYMNQLIGVLAVEEYGETGRNFNEDDMRLLTIFAGQAAGAVHSAQLFHNIRKINKELENRVNELHSAQEEIQKINVELKELNSNKDKFFSIISHDLRSPFQGLTSAAEILSDDFENLPKEEIEKLIKMLNDRIKNVYKLLDNLLQWSLNQMNKHQYEPADIDLSNVVNKIISELQNDLRKKKLTVTNDIPDNIIVYADINMLQTIIRNLLTNGIKFSFEGGSLNVSSVSRDHLVEVSIRDYGTGIPPGICEKLFHVDRSHSVIGTAGEKGTGLGLPLCREFVEMHSGKIWVESIEGNGSTFHFTLHQQ